MVRCDTRGMDVFCFLFSLIAAGCSTAWGPGTEMETGSGTAPGWPGRALGTGMGQGWDGMPICRSGPVAGQGCGKAGEQPCCSIVGLERTALGWAETEFHKDLEMYIFI